MELGVKKNLRPRKLKLKSRMQTSNPPHERIPTDFNSLSLTLHHQFQFQVKMDKQTFPKDSILLPVDVLQETKAETLPDPREGSI